MNLLCRLGHHPLAPRANVGDFVVKNLHVDKIVLKAQWSDRSIHMIYEGLIFSAHQRVRSKMWRLGPHFIRYFNSSIRFELSVY